MSRIRSLKPEFFRSRSLAKCSIPARLTFAGLWCEADDVGNGIADTDLLKGALWPKDPTVAAQTIEGHLSELVETGHIVFYEAEGERYFHIVKWTDHQSASTLKTLKGKFPRHPDPVPEDSGERGEDSGEGLPCGQVPSGKISLDQGSGIKDQVSSSEAVDDLAPVNELAQRSALRAQEAGAS